MINGEIHANSSPELNTNTTKEKVKVKYQRKINTYKDPDYNPDLDVNTMIAGLEKSESKENGNPKNIAELGYASLLTPETCREFREFKFDAEMVQVLENIKKSGCKISSFLNRGLSQSFYIIDSEGNTLGGRRNNDGITYEVSGKQKPVSYILEKVNELLGLNENIFQNKILKDIYIQEPDRLFSEKYFPNDKELFNYIHDNYVNTLSDEEVMQFKKITVSYIESQKIGMINSLCIDDPNVLKLKPIEVDGQKRFVVEAKYTTIGKDIYVYFGNE